MFLIHVGFCMYEVGVSRRRNHLHTLMKNTMLIPLVSVTFFLFGWWLYFGVQQFPFGPINYDAATTARPWSALMATHLSGPSPDLGITADQAVFWHRLNGVFWAAFLLFSWTAASIVSGAVRHRAHPVWRLLDPGHRNRLLHLDHRCGLGLELGRLDGPVSRLS